MGLIDSAGKLDDDAVAKLTEIVENSQENYETSMDGTKLKYLSNMVTMTDKGESGHHSNFKIKMSNKKVKSMFLVQTAAVPAMGDLEHDMTSRNSKNSNKRKFLLVDTSGDKKALFDLKPSRGNRNSRPQLQILDSINNIYSDSQIHHLTQIKDNPSLEYSADDEQLNLRNAGDENNNIKNIKNVNHLNQNGYEADLIEEDEEQVRFQEPKTAIVMLSAQTSQENDVANDDVRI